jgi:ATP-dependent protease ClpP protease subunit
MRKENEALRVVGLDRDWPGKVLADAAKDVDTGQSRYVVLDQVQKDTDRDFFMTGDEAQEYGLIDHVMKNREDLERLVKTEE